MVNRVSQMRRCIDAVFANKETVNLDHLKIDVPTDPTEFYNDFGLLRHDRTGLPVKKLAAYQKMFWEWLSMYRYRLAVKSQKVGLSTSVLMEDFQQTVLPPTNPLSTMGFETLVIGQKESKAKDHLKTIRDLVVRSEKYKPFLITKPRPYLRRTDVSTTTQLIIENPYEPTNPSRIIALGSSPGAVWSWKKVKKIHMSDPAASNVIDDSELYDAAFSRLAITMGWFVIESPPRGQRGQLWEIYKSSKLNQHTESQEPGYSNFKITEIPYSAAIEAGVMTEEFFTGERERLGPRFGQYYECEFLNPSNTWYDDSLFSYDSTMQLG